jgi:hypothetical protein
MTTTTDVDAMGGSTVKAGVASAAMEMNATNDTGSNTQTPHELLRNRTEKLRLGRNGVKLNPFHLLYAYQQTLKKKHGFYETLSGLVRDDLFMIFPEDLEKEKKSLTERLLKDPNSRFFRMTWVQRKRRNGAFYVQDSKVLDYCRQHIPNPSIILHLIQKAVELFADVKDAKSGDVFFSKATWKVHVNVVWHIKLGCVRDMPGVNYYYYLTTKSGKKKLMCICGISQLEGFHAHLRHIIRGFHTLPRLVTCL